MDARTQLRDKLDAMDEEQLRALRDEVEDSSSPEHDIEGVRLPKKEALMLINQSMVHE